MHGKEKSTLLAGSHNDAIDTIEYIVNEEQIDCDFSRVAGYLFLGENDEYKTLEKELKAVNEVGYQNVEMKTAIPLGIQIPALKFSAQAQFHIQKYVQGLCKAILKLGGYIFTGEHVRDMIDGKNIVLTTDSGKQIVAHNVVVATNTPVFDRIKLHTKQVAYRTYVIGFKVKKGLFEQALYWDTEEPYHYIRLQPIDGDDKNEMLIVGGEDHRTGEEADPESRFAALEDWTRKRIFTGNKVEFKWSGEIFEPNDGIAFIGKDPAHKGNVFIATGASGNGMTHAAIAARLLRDLISKKQNPLIEIYDPNRSPFGDIVTLVTENLNTAGQYAKALAPSDVSSEEAIEAGEGAIMREGLKQKAVYKDESGVVHKLSAKCTHLGATLCWNSCEKSWDCPAHGSRFAGTGEVICGPANENIPPSNG